MTPGSGEGTNPPSPLRRLLRAKESSALLALVGIIVLISVVSPSFLTQGNLYLVTRQVAFVAIVALGSFFVILTAGIDLSVGSTVSLSGMTAGLAMAAGVPWPLAAALGLLTGAGIGAINGSLVSYVRVTPFIVTLGMLCMAGGMSIYITKGEAVRKIPLSFINGGSADLFGIPGVVVILLAVAAVAHVLVKFTVFGRRVMAIGGNEEAAELSGIDVRFVKFFTYVLSGAYASLTGVLYIARFRIAQADSGKGMELDAIAAAVIGGTSLFGGEGSVGGVLIGAMIMGVVRNGLVLMNVSSYLQDFIIGLVIVLAAIVDAVRRRKR